MGILYHETFDLVLYGANLVLELTGFIGGDGDAETLLANFEPGRKKETLDGLTQSQIG